MSALAGPAHATIDAATSGYTIGVDIGGTFTDCVIISAAGEVGTGKVPTRPDDRARSFFESVSEAARGFGLSLEEMLERCSRLVHGTTTGTNALLTRTGADAGLLVTVGHRDSTHMMNGGGRLNGVPPDRVLDLPATDKPEPLIPKRRIREVVERVDFAGDVVVALDEQSVLDAFHELRAEGASSIAIALLWSVRNKEHERRILELIRREAPDVFVSCSSELSPRVGELERTNTTIVNSYVGPLMNRYVDAIETGARARGFDGRVLFAQCAGGAMTAEEARHSPVRTMHSGPVSGTVGSALLAARMAEPNLIVTDMGGTSFDVSVVRDLQPDVREISQIERFDVAMPMVFIDTVGAGGGSIAWVDEVGRLNVGPQSATGVPGPACYGRGGTEPTVTDADVVLGVIDPDHFLHGRMRLDRAAAEAAVGRLAGQLGMELHETAAGINRIIDSKMADLLRRMSVLRGMDPREFACFCYGGAGPVHCAAVARDVGVKRLIVPPLHAAAAWSAFGAAIAPISHVHQLWDVHAMPADAVAVDQSFEQLEAEARRTLEHEGYPVARQRLQRSLRMKYRAQFFDVDVPLPAGGVTPETIAQAENEFARLYDDLHGPGSGYREGGSEITGFVVRSEAVADPVPLARPMSPEVVGRLSRPVYWSEYGEFADTPVVRMPSGILDEELTGPLLLELPDTVVVLRPGQRASFDALGNLFIELNEE